MITEPVPVSPHDTRSPANHANPRGLLADSRFAGQDGGGAVPSLGAGLELGCGVALPGDAASPRPPDARFDRLDRARSRRLP
jgi:hypothetical protein